MKIQNYFDFKGKTAVITGGRRGLGKAMIGAFKKRKNYEY